MARELQDTESLDTTEESMTPERQAMLDVIATAIVSKRQEAINFRTASGIEGTWLYCEEATAGIDDANRSEYSGSKWYKSTALSGPITTGVVSSQEEVKSRVFPMVTARYVDVGAAKVGEILLPPDGKAFNIKPTPNPDLIGAKKDQTQLTNPDGTPAERDPTRAEMPGQPTIQHPGAILSQEPPSGAAEAPGVPLTVKDVAEEKLQEAQDAAKKAETRIYDWMVEGGYRAEMRKVIFDASRLGVGILKGPIPKISTAMAYKDGQLEIDEKPVPGFAWVDPWNLFPDPACGENIHNGDYILEYDRLSRRQVDGLKKEPKYIASQLDIVLDEGPSHGSKDNTQKPSDDNDDYRTRFPVWYFHGQISRDELMAMNPGAAEKLKEETTHVYAVVTLINDTVVKATLSAAQVSAKFPYHSVPWTRRPGHWAGIGTAEKIRTAQRIITGATRALLNNAGYSAGTQLVMDPTGIQPHDKKWQINSSVKLWLLTSGAAGVDINKIFGKFDFTNVTDPLLKVIDYGFRLAEESSNIPLVTQGQSGKTQPDTFGGMQLQDNNANQLLRDIGYAFDDYITEPLVRQLYEWLLMSDSEDVPDEEKGDFHIDAHGSSALVELYIQNQAIARATDMAPNPVYGADPKKAYKKFLTSNRIDSREIMYSEEDQAKLDQQPPPVDPRIKVAEMKLPIEQAKVEQAAQRDQAEIGLKREIAELDTELALEKTRVDTDRDVVYVQAEAQRTQLEHEARMEELQIKERLAILDYANKRDIELDKVKKDLAETTMTLKMQEKLSLADMGVKERDSERKAIPQVATAKAEPKGKADDGKAFQG